MFYSSRKLCWKAKIRQGKAHIGLCLAALSGRGTMTEQDVEIARINRDEAIKCESYPSFMRCVCCFDP